MKSIPVEIVKIILDDELFVTVKVKPTWQGKELHLGDATLSQKEKEDEEK